METSLRDWLSADAEHASVFERMTDTWEQSAGLRAYPFERVAERKRRSRATVPLRVVAGTIRALLLRLMLRTGLQSCAKHR